MVAMRQIGLNGASDPFMRSPYRGIKKGFLVVLANVPGPHTVQMEPDSRFWEFLQRLLYFTLRPFGKQKQWFNMHFGFLKIRDSCLAQT